MFKLSFLKRKEIMNRVSPAKAVLNDRTIAHTKE